jgi:hypothetical protein
MTGYSVFSIMFGDDLLYPIEVESFTCISANRIHGLENTASQIAARQRQLE